MNPTISCKLLLPVSNLMTMQDIRNYQGFKSQDTSAANWGTIFLMILNQEKVYIHYPVAKYVVMLNKLMPTYARPTSNLV